MKKNTYPDGKRIKYVVIVLVVIFSISLSGQEGIRMYAFGHSLIDHRPPAIATPGNETTIMHWMSEIAMAADRSFAGGGQYGFLTNHDDLPPVAQWGYEEILPVWNDEVETFAQANINTILLTVANFIQYELPTAPHPLDSETSVIASTTTIFDWVENQGGAPSYFIYANWPEMDLQQAFPPTPPSVTEVDAFHTLTKGDFIEWWKIYQDDMMEVRPDYRVRLIPVGSIISDILTKLIPGEIPFEELYEDSAPHGRPNIYFLAGMITYMSVAAEKIPADYQPDEIIHPAIRNNLADINDYVWQALNEFNFANGESRVFVNDPNTSVKVLDEEVDIFPNPASDLLFINSGQSKVEAVVYDYSGNLMVRKDVYQSPLSIYYLSPGLYIIELRDQQGKTIYSKKFVKQ